MTNYMIAEDEHDYIQSYENATAELSTSPSDQNLQHKAVLSLARAGSLGFALSEYKRYALNNVRQHEDIMALGGRLSKDLYLRNTGKKALDYARDSAHQYEAAFQDTKGYYSGVNAATMALMSKMPLATITDRAKAILNILPKPENLTTEDHYFIEATRAECHLLMGDISQAQACLDAAIIFDPLNYTAHATTLKQFKMILAKRDESTEWLSKFNPPKAMHFAGHINLALSQSEQADLKLSIIDTIQKNDIGFGYGSLAAGSDILIAEALLGEGGQLHIILPCNIHDFLEHSVKPFGSQWVERFETCLANACSLKIATPNAPWPHPKINQLVGQFAMGKAILQGHQFSVPSCQLLIWDQKPKTSYTAVHAADWNRTGKDQILIPLKSSNPSMTTPEVIKPNYSFVLKRSDETRLKHFKTAADAMETAKTLRAEKPELSLGLHIDIDGSPSETELNKILENSPPQCTLMTEIFASVLGYQQPKNLNMSFAGSIKIDKDTCIRCYSANL